MRCFIGTNKSEKLKMGFFPRKSRILSGRVELGVLQQRGFRLLSNSWSGLYVLQSAIEAKPPLRPLCLVLKILLQQRELNKIMLVSSVFGRVPRLSRN